MSDSVLARARGLWAGLAGVPAAFPAEGRVEVVASAGSLRCPPRWADIVVLGGAGIAIVPADGLAEVVRAALAGLPAVAVTDVSRLRAGCAPCCRWPTSSARRAWRTWTSRSSVR